MTWMKQGKQAPPTPTTAGGKVDPAAAAAHAAQYTSPKFIKGSLLDMYAFVLESPWASRYNIEDLIWSETGYALAEAETRQYSFTYEPSEVS